MCGIAGIFHPNHISDREKAQVFEMLKAIRHRGPDGLGVYKESPDVCLGSVRLSMVDSQNEIHWLDNESRSILLVFNGEIYNHKELRLGLENKGHVFRTKSDGETIVHLYEEEGVQFLNQLDGMFAFSLWDPRKKLLLLARDPFGIKPLYYQKHFNCLKFASELKALKKISEKALEIDLVSLSSYFHYRFVAPPRTIFQGICKLEPGSFLTAQDDDITVRRYAEIPLKKKPSFQTNFQDIWKEALETTADCDHPIGLFLSGGLDSSAILASIPKIPPHPIQTFTIGYENECDQDEGLFASSLARCMGSRHEYQKINPKDVRSDLTKTIWHLEEPLYSTVSLSTYRLAKMASRHVKGVMTGDGSDELLLGYSYLLKPYEAFKNGENWIDAYLYQIGWVTGNWGERLFQEDVIKNRENLLSSSGNLHPFDVMRLFEIKYRLPEYHLARMDRLSMAHGLEARVPFLRKKVVEFFLSFPSEALLIPGKQKEFLKSEFSKLLPKESLERKKQSFTAPYISWLQGPLKEEVFDLILGTDFYHPLQLKKEGLIDVLTNCYEGDGAAFSVLWGLFTLHKWYDKVYRS